MRRCARWSVGGPAAALAAVLGALTLAACAANATGDPTPSAPTTTGPPSRAATAAASTKPTTPTTTPAPTEPDGTARLLPGNRVVAFYGAAGAPALGVLGTSSAEGIWPRLASQAAAYRTAGTRVLPAYELIADVIQGSPGADGDYEVQVPDATIEEYLRAAHTHHALLILDIQPGLTAFLPLAQRLEKYLVDPSVGLALDPEWRLAPGQRPDEQIGRVSAAEVNATSAWLDTLTRAHRLPQKLLLVHQFTSDEIEDKPGLLPRASLAVVFNMDGFGSRADKIAKYDYLATDRRFGLGLKLFYHQDVDLYAPAEALAIRPAPDVVDYE